MLDYRIILTAGLHGWEVVEFARLHEDQEVWLVRVRRPLCDQVPKCLGLLHDLQNMTTEEIAQELEELGKPQKLQWRYLE